MEHVLHVMDWQKSDVDLNKIIPDQQKVLLKEECPLGKFEKWTFKQIEVILKNAGHDINQPINSIEENTLNEISWL